MTALAALNQAQAILQAASAPRLLLDLAHDDAADRVRVANALRGLGCKVYRMNGLTCSVTRFWVSRPKQEK